MEDDRAQADLGIAADIEEAQAPEPVQRQPRKRFVGRRKAAEGSRNGGVPSVEDSGAIQGQFWVFGSPVLRSESETVNETEFIMLMMIM